MNLTKQIFACGLLLSVVPAQAMENQAPQPGFFDKARDAFLARNWGKGNEHIAYSVGLWTALGGVASFGVYKIAQAMDSYQERKEQEGILRAQGEKFMNNYEQLCTQAAIKAGLIEGTLITPTLHEFFIAQRNTGAFEMLDYVSAQIGRDLSLIVEKFVKDFDEAVKTPASNKDERMQVALYNLAGFIDWLTTGQFQFVEMPEVASVQGDRAAKTEAAQKAKRPAKRAQSKRI